MWNSNRTFKVAQLGCNGGVETTMSGRKHELTFAQALVVVRCVLHYVA
jgi:hypothetical protein